MDKVFSDEAWEDYCFWINEDKKILKKINDLLKDIERNLYTGIGNPEPLKGNWSGWYSRQINKKDRLIYKIENDSILIANCKTHYGQK